MEDLTEAYREFDIFVMPSHKETFGLVLLEAMASGCVCVANKAGGPLEILNYGDAGVLIESCAPSSLSQALQSILENPESYSHFKALARQRVLDKYSQHIPFLSLIGSDEPSDVKSA